MRRVFLIVMVIAISLIALGMSKPHLVQKRQFFYDGYENEYGLFPPTLPTSTEKPGFVSYFINTLTKESNNCPQGQRKDPSGICRTPV